MNENQLSKRLKAVSKFVPEQSRLADIGSDHAYLPVALFLQGKITYAVAGEVVKGPYEAAKRQVKKNKLEQSIMVRLADGLDAIKPEDMIDTITICGMGGALIRDILEAGYRNQRIIGNERLILQPNIGEKNLREWLTAHQYTIISELILEENKKIYEIIVAQKEKTTVTYTNKEQRFGPLLLKEKSEIFKDKWRQELKQREAILFALLQAGTDQEVRIQQLNDEIVEIKEVIMNDH